MGPRGRARGGGRCRRASGGGGRAPAGLTDRPGARPATVRRAAAPMRVLVAEAIAPEGVEALQAAGHEVVVQTGLKPDERSRDRRRLRRAHRPEPGRGRRGPDRRGSAAPGDRSRRGRRRQRRPRRGDAGRDHRRQRADRQHDRRGRAHDRAAARAGAARPVRGRVDAARRVGPGPLQGVQLGGRTLGIIGLGKIGMAVAERARGLG